MTGDLAEWLEAQGLGQYARVLAENEVDLEALRLLSEHDLQELGIPLGPRKKLLKAIETTGSAGTIAPPRSPDSYTPKHLAEKILTSKTCARRRAQAGYGAVFRSQRLDGTACGSRPGGGTEDP